VVSAVSSPNPSSFPIDAEEVADLRTTLHGDAFLPSDDGYTDAIAAWSLLVRHTPALAVMAETADDIARAVAFAAAYDLPVGVMGTGHGQPLACDAGVLVNTSRMRGVAIDSDAGIARVEPGAKWADVIPVAQKHGLAPLNGSSSDVGVVGYTLGGGHGWLARKYGRAADRIVAAEVVLASGEQVRVTAESDPELLWALKGGGGNFGVVAALEFGLVPVSEVYGGSVMYPLSEAREVLEAFSRWSPTLPAEITASVGILRFPPLPDLPPVLQGAAVIAVRACAVGDLATGEALIAPMRALATPVMDTFGVMPYAAIDAISMDPVDPLPVIGMTMLLRDLDAETIEAILNVAGPEVSSPLLMIDIRDLRPAPGQAPAADTRAHLGGLPVYVVAIPMSEEMGQAIEEAIASVRASLAPHAADRVVFNFLGDGDSGPDRTRAAFPAEAWERLREVKRRHDPGNRFRFNHNIAP
jgi:FAD/FMN-containing dehydrogenase